MSRTIQERPQPSPYPDSPTTTADSFVLVDSPETPDHGIRMVGTHTFPSGLPDWSNLKIIHKNTLPPRSSFYVYETAAEALTRDPEKSKKVSLSGKWKFNLANSPFDAPSDFQDPNYDVGKWGDIEVPGMWQLQGYGKGPQYVH